MSDPAKFGVLASGEAVGQIENPWVQQSRKIAYENDWIVVYHDQVLRPDGQPGIYGVVHYRSRSVGVVAVDQGDRVLLVGQFRYTTGRYSWEIPAGGASEGRTLCPLLAGNCVKRRDSRLGRCS